MEVVPATFLLLLKLSKIYSVFWFQLTIYELIIIEFANELMVYVLELEYTLALSFTFHKVPTISISVRVLKQRIAIEKVIFEVSSILISIFVSENPWLHLWELELALEFFTIAKVKDASALEMIVDELANVVISCSFIY